MPDWTALAYRVSDATYEAWNAHDADGMVVEDVHHIAYTTLFSQLAAGT